MCGSLMANAMSFWRLWKGQQKGLLVFDSAIGLIRKWEDNAICSFVAVKFSNVSNGGPKRGHVRGW